MKRERWEQLAQHINCHVLYEADMLELLFEVRRLSERYEPEPGFCEHGIREGDWCEDCNKAYKEARREAGYEETKGVEGVRCAGPEAGQGSESGSNQAGGKTREAG